MPLTLKAKHKAKWSTMDKCWNRVSTSRKKKFHIQFTLVTAVSGCYKGSDVFYFGNLFLEDHEFTFHTNGWCTTCVKQFTSLNATLLFVMQNFTLGYPSIQMFILFNAKYVNKNRWIYITILIHSNKLFQNKNSEENTQKSAIHTRTWQSCRSFIKYHQFEKKIVIAN